MRSTLVDLFKPTTPSIKVLAEATESTIISHDAGYINKDLETIVGLQTDKPLKRYSIPLMVV